MIDLDSVADSIVTTLRDIPALVTLLGGDSTRIFAFKDHFPDDCNLLKAVFALTPPAVLVAFLRSGPGRPVEGEWRHFFSIVMMADASAAALWRTIADGRVTATGQRFRFSDITNGNCFTPMDLSMQRILSREGRDYFEATLILSEIGVN
jgi:hypothetical protein